MVGGYIVDTLRTSNSQCLERPHRTHTHSHQEYSMKEAPVFSLDLARFSLILGHPVANLAPFEEIVAVRHLDY